MTLGIFSANDLSYSVPDYSVNPDILGSFLHSLTHTAKEVATALGMIVAFFAMGGNKKEVKRLSPYDNPDISYAPYVLK
jgi:hypothetical protein